MTLTLVPHKVYFSCKDFTHKVYFSYMASSDQLRPKTDPCILTDTLPTHASQQNETELFRKSFQIYPHSLSRNFIHEHPFGQLSLDHLVLHTLRYEIMYSGSTYILLESMLSYRCGISDNSVFPIFSITSH